MHTKMSRVNLMAVEQIREVVMELSPTLQHSHTRPQYGAVPAYEYPKTIPTVLSRQSQSPLPGHTTQYPKPACMNLQVLCDHTDAETCFNRILLNNTAMPLAAQVSDRHEMCRMVLKRTGRYKISQVIMVRFFFIQPRILQAHLHLILCRYLLHTRASSCEICPPTTPHAR